MLKASIEKASIGRTPTGAPPTPNTGETTMEKKNKPVRIELTEEQRNKIRETTGKDANAIELSAEELEERVAPIEFYPSR